MASTVINLPADGVSTASAGEAQLNTFIDRLNNLQQQQQHHQQHHEHHQSDGGHETTVDGGEIRINMGDLDPTDAPQGQPQRDASAQHGAEALAVLMPYFAKFGIFILILLLKILYSHRYGLLIIVATVAIWHYADSTLTTQITLRTHTRYKQFVSKLVWVVILLSLNLVGIYYFLDEDHSLLHRLIFLPKGLEGGLEVWTLLWMVIITDYSVKYCTIIVKTLATLIPKSLLSHQFKGSLYMLIERVTLLYRSLLPIVPWYYFLLGTSDGPWFSAVLFIAYVVFKFLNLYSQWDPLKKSILRVFTSQESYGRKPTNQELEASEGTCPVCHDEYTDPIMLLCKHTFCQDCVLVWLDRETSCPMCRAKIVTGDNTFRDGSSSMAVQFF